MLSHERRDELAFSVNWFGCRTLKCGVALVYLTYSTIQNRCGSVKKKFVRCCSMSCVFFLQDLQFGQPVQ